MRSERQEGAWLLSDLKVTKKNFVLNMGFDRKPVYSMKDWADVAWSDR